MKKTILLLCGWLTASVAFAQMPAAPAAPTSEPQALATAFFKALEAEDVPALTSITTDDFAIVNYDGQVADRDLLGQGLGGGFLVVETATTSNLRTRTYNNDTAIVTGESAFKGSLQGTNFKTTASFTVTCVKGATGWKIASAQLSGAGQ